MLTPQTPEPKLASALGIKTQVYFKREDLHPFGSHKGRSIPIMIEAYAKRGFKNFVISSSGNAALAAARYIVEHNNNSPHDKLHLEIFVGEKIDRAKLTMLEEAKNSNIVLAIAPNPKQSAFQMDKSGKAKLLRQSTDGLALKGYEGLAKELSEIKNLSAVFIPTSSGTTAEGLYRGFNKLGINPEIHIVQTEAVHPMVDNFPSPIRGGARGGVYGQSLNTPSTVLPLRGGGSERGGAQSLASAIVDKVALRKNKVLEAIKNSRGFGWIATNTQIVQAIKLAKTMEGIDLSPNSALSLAGLEQAVHNGKKWNGPVVCLITGT